MLNILCVGGEWVGPVQSQECVVKFHGPKATRLNWQQETRTMVTSINVVRSHQILTNVVLSTVVGVVLVMKWDHQKHQETRSLEERLVHRMRMHVADSWHSSSVIKQRSAQDDLSGGCLLTYAYCRL